MSSVRVDGANLWYEISGKEGDVPLVMIGGFALVNNQFDFCNRYLQPHHRLLHWHYRGVGKSDWTLSGPCSVERWVDDLKAILDHEGIDRINLWCTSTGSSIGLRFAAKYPNVMNGLIAYPFVRADDTWRAIYRVSAGVAQVFGIETLSRLYAGVVLPPLFLYTKEGSEYERWAKKRYRENVNVATLDAVLDAYSHVDLTSDIRNITCPTLLLLGDESALNSDDRLNSASFAHLVRQFTSLKPDAVLAKIKGAGSTYCMITKPQACCAAVTRFLTSIDRPQVKPRSRGRTHKRRAH
jgi:pimeloyl-ACP methyl ester carboxylesterase